MGQAAFEGVLEEGVDVNIQRGGRRGWPKAGTWMRPAHWSEGYASGMQVLGADCRAARWVKAQNAGSLMLC